MNEMVPAEVRLVALQVAYDSYREGDQEIWQRLYDVMDIPPMQQSPVELIENIRRTIERLNTRIAELEATGAV
ncbi:hypothetical protein ACFWBG_11445 [Nocardia salmonicida]|uniref:hypothetical protein n=1 Tax=Nocardia salmonicida TaxID=53431 RepID=UPI00367040A2